jgi:hypothetical protein
MGLPATQWLEALQVSLKGDGVIIRSHWFAGKITHGKLIAPVELFTI